MARSWVVWHWLCGIGIMDMHNLQQLSISIIALWVNMFTRLWIIYSDKGAAL